MSSPRQRRPRQPRTLTASLASIVLSFESLVVVLAALVLFGLRSVPPAVALGGGGALLVVLVAGAALARKPMGIALGWLVQIVLVASIVIEPTVGVVGLIFGAVWTYSMIVGRRVDRAAPGAEGSR